MRLIEDLEHSVNVCLIIHTLLHQSMLIVNFATLKGRELSKA